MQRFTHHVASSSPLLKRLLAGDAAVPYVLFRHAADEKGSCHYATDFPVAEGSGRAFALLPGSFNPLHAGHLSLAEGVAQMSNQSVFFEMSASHPDKGYLSETDVVQRVSQFFSGRVCQPVIVSRCSLYIDKARMFPHSTIVIGADTMVRILNPKYYEGNNFEGVLTMLQQIASQGVNFFVAGRIEDSTGKEDSGTFITGDDVLQKMVPVAGDRARMPPDMFRSIPEDVFRVDLSSTELRRARLETAAATRL
jgi:hypothetical protein